jgi:hypothetical protein
MKNFLIAISLQQNKEYINWKNNLLSPQRLVGSHATVLLFFSSTFLLSQYGSKFD